MRLLLCLLFLLGQGCESMHYTPPDYGITATERLDGGPVVSYLLQHPQR